MSIGLILEFATLNYFKDGWSSIAKNLVVFARYFQLSISKTFYWHAHTK